MLSIRSHKPHRVLESSNLHLMILYAVRAQDPVCMRRFDLATSLTESAFHSAIFRKVEAALKIFGVSFILHLPEQL